MDLHYVLVTDMNYIDEFILLFLLSTRNTSLRSPHYYSSRRQDSSLTGTQKVMSKTMTRSLTILTLASRTNSAWTQRPSTVPASCLYRARPNPLSLHKDLVYAHQVSIGSPARLPFAQHAGPCRRSYERPASVPRRAQRWRCDGHSSRLVAECRACTE